MTFLCNRPITKQLIKKVAHYPFSYPVFVLLKPLKEKMHLNRYFLGFSKKILGTEANRKHRNF